MINIPSVKDIVKNDAKVRFSHYKEKELWYVADNGFLFPVPISDTGNAIFNNEDKALLFMRWIRKHCDYLANA